MILWILFYFIISVDCQDFCNIVNYALPCKYACRCKGSCDSKGNCLGSSCSDGWFGLACQYNDLVIDAKIEPPSGETLRSNSSRQDCSLRLLLHYVLFTWSEPQTFTWLRVNVINKSSFRNITLSLNNALCQNARLISVDETTLDIFCDNNVAMTTLKLEGNSVESICTIFISGGRNFALFQKTSQSSTFHSDDSKYAVDGKILVSCYGGRCSHTNIGDITPYWTVNFGQEYNIKKCVLYNRIDSEKERLKGFLLEMLDDNNLTIFTYQNASEPTKLVYTVLNLNGSSVAGVRISQTNKFNQDATPFVCLNEFEAYGDCLPGFWGLECKKLCPESCKSSCHVQLGTCNTICNGKSDPPLCSIECASTKWGPNCLNNCNASCYNSSCDKLTGLCSTGCIGYQDFPHCTANNSCDAITGECFSCKPGYTGIYCNNPCSVTHFGSNCRETCSAQCSQNVCDPQTGRCLTCIPGYKGEFCNIICDSKYYGQNCSNICSTSCVDQTCDRYDGHCLRCNKTMYGRQCLEKCSSRCLNDSCDVSTGKCLACKPDYVGDFCDRNPMDVYVAVGIAVGAATVVVLLIMAGTVAYKRRVQPTKLKSDAGIDNVAKSQENDHYESIQNIDRNDSISIHDHYDIDSSESDGKQKENESQYETVSSQNPYDKLSSDVDETSNAQYEKVASPNQYENFSRKKQLGHFAINDK
ncbi:uncharacterized protein LOC106076529 isoform X2 [Biomphalaria glabrata]|uniref:Uncharacterized protein LOC106076529 isoform X2 n=1 Tax=Biomphalaria glabrata TaxID=6526 RepID=A0A9W3ACK9_BIOGL|nr:uncharacterized protein LOC106076529 isoform X2 [Biomphalaria glabrata]